MVEVVLQSLRHFTDLTPHPNPNSVEVSEGKKNFKRPKSHYEFNPRRAQNKSVTYRARSGNCKQGFPSWSCYSHSLKEACMNFTRNSLEPKNRLPCSIIFSWQNTCVPVCQHSAEPMVSPAAAHQGSKPGWALLEAKQQHSQEEKPKILLILLPVVQITQKFIKKKYRQTLVSSTNQIWKKATLQGVQ